MADAVLPNYDANTKLTWSAVKPLSEIGLIFTSFLKYVYVAAGLLLLLMLISGGVTLMTAAGDQNKTKEGYGRIQAGIVGFLIVFISYFVVQIVEVILGVKIL